jgi:coenzyme F420-reducing hydrogenase delta subunit
MKNQSLRLSLFYCSNSLSAEEISSCSDRIKDVKINFISLPCSGKVSLIYLLKAIETGSDGIMLVTCKIGECKYLQGNLRAQKRMEAVDELLHESGLGKGHVKFVQQEGVNKADSIVNEINNFKVQLMNLMQMIQI